MARATYTNHVELGRLVTNTTVVYLAANSKLPCQDSRMESLESIFHFAEKGYYTSIVVDFLLYYVLKSDETIFVSTFYYVCCRQKLLLQKYIL